MCKAVSYGPNALFFIYLFLLIHKWASTEFELDTSACYGVKLGVFICGVSFPNSDLIRTAHLYTGICLCSTVIWRQLCSWVSLPD